MLDAHLRPLIDPPLTKLAKFFIRIGVTANMVTLFGFFIGVCAMIMIACNKYEIGLFLICTNRLCDGLDGAVARNSLSSNFGGFLDIVCDFIFYSGIVFAFGISDPSKLFYSAFLIFSFTGPMSSFLAYNIIATKLEKLSDKNGIKSFYHSTGLCEGSETILLLVLLCVIPQYHNILCITYGILCWVTTIDRIFCARNSF